MTRPRKLISHAPNPHSHSRSHSHSHSQKNAQKSTDNLYEHRRKRLLTEKDWTGVESPLLSFYRPALTPSSHANNRSDTSKENSASKSRNASKKLKSAAAAAHDDRPAHQSSFYDRNNVNTREYNDNNNRNRRRVKSPVFRNSYMMTNAIPVSAADESIDVRIGVDAMRGSQTQTIWTWTARERRRGATRLASSDSNLGFDAGENRFTAESEDPVPIAEGESQRRKNHHGSRSGGFIQSLGENDTMHEEEFHLEASSSAASSNMRPWSNDAFSRNATVGSVAVVSDYNALEEGPADTAEGAEDDMADEEELWREFLQPSHHNATKEGLGFPERPKDQLKPIRAIATTNETKASIEPQPLSKEVDGRASNVYRAAYVPSPTKPTRPAPSEEDTNQLWKDFVFGHSDINSNSSPAAASDPHTFPDCKGKNSSIIVNANVKVNNPQQETRITKRPHPSSLLDSDDTSTNNTTTSTTSTFSLDRPSSVANASIAPAVLYDASRHPVLSSPDPLSVDHGGTLHVGRPGLQKEQRAVFHRPRPFVGAGVSPPPLMRI